MSGKANAIAAYSRVANTETNPLQQVVMLYDGAIKFLRLAANDIEAGDLAARAAHTNRALDILAYLQSILDFDRGGEVAPTLNLLYLSVTAETLRAGARRDKAMMLRAAELLVPVRDSWASNAAGPAALPRVSAPVATVALT
ncbi:MAG: flagellar export chaperone FliS [Blastocatellia bacterium]|nr:flagellar export chaperone FliS [Blastocatellia bacterium]